MRNGWFKIAAIVGLVVFFGMGTAMAGNWTAVAANRTVLTGGHLTNFAAANASVDFVYTTIAGESLAINDTLTITLTGGAKFSGTLPTLRCGGAGNADLGAGNNVAAPPLSGGTAGTTTATWRCLTAATTNSAFTLNSNTANIFDVTAIGPTGAVDILMDMKTSTGTQIGPAARSLSGGGGGRYAFIGGYALTIIQTANENTADVRATVPYTKFLNNAVLGTATVLTVTNASDADSIPNAQQFNLKKILVSLVGDFTGISKVTGTGLTGSSSDGTTTGGAAGEFLINAEKTAAYAVNTTDTGSGIAIAVAPTFTIDGSTSQAARAFTVKVETFDQGVVWLAYSYIGPKTHYTILRNGVSFTANSIGGYNTIKISDKSGNQPTLGGKVNVVAWDAAGVRLADAAGVTSILLKSNETITLTGDVLAARFVGTAMKYEVSIESTGAMITNVKKTPEGFGSTAWTNANGAL